MTFRQLLCVAVAISTLAGFSTGKGEPQRAHSARATPILNPEIELLERGDAPRRPLRWRLSKGQHESYRSVAMVSTSTTIDGELIPLDDSLPTIVEGDLFIHEINRAGQIIVGLRLDTPDELTGYYRMDNRGRILALGDEPTRLRSVIDSDHAHQLADHIRHTQLIFPKQEVGVGARWSVITDEFIGGVAHEHVATYTVTAIDADLIELAVETEIIEDKAQNIDMPAMDPDGRASIQSTRRKSTTSHALRLDRIGPIAVKTASEMVQVIRIEERGETYEIITTLNAGYAAESDIDTSELAGVDDPSQD